MDAILNVSIPVFAIILGGYLAARGGLLGQGSTVALNAFVYYFALPLVVGYAPQWAAKKVFGVVNVAYLFALSQFFMAWLVAVLYVAVPGAHLVLARNFAGGPSWLAVLLAITFATDTGAYACGRLLGRHRLAPAISPNKTIEGAIGGLAFGGAAAIGAPLLLGSLAALPLLGGAGWMGSAARPWQFVLGLGMACAVTALPILILLMEKMQILRRPLGQRILRYASLDDIAIWGVLALILMDWERVGRQGLFLLVFALTAWAVRRLMQAVPARDRWYLGLVWLAAVAFAADWAGLHYMVGAFLAGAVLDAEWFDQDQMDQLRHHVLLVVMPVFFLSTGLRTSWTVGGGAVFGVAALLLVAAVAGKLAGVHLAGRWLGWARGEASLVGWLLQTKALIMIIFANVLLDKQVITSGTFTALLLMAVASTMLTVPVVTSKLKRLAALIERER